MRLRRKLKPAVATLALLVAVAIPALPALADYEDGSTDCTPWYVRISAETQGSTSVWWSGLSQPVSYYNPTMQTDYHMTSISVATWWVDAVDIADTGTNCLP